MIELILGGARSGKSRHAQQRAQESGLEVVFCATAQALDDEMQNRIAQHRADRPAGWRTVEEPLQLAATLAREASPSRCLLVDCLTLWLSNVLLEKREEEIGKLLRVLPALPGHLILVSNEVGFGIVPDNALARRFRDEQGRLNQRIAQIAQQVTLLVAGLPLALKSGA